MKQNKHNNIFNLNYHSIFNPLYVIEISIYDVITHNIRNLLGSLNIQKLKVSNLIILVLFVISISLHMF